MTLWLRSLLLLAIAIPALADESDGLVAEQPAADVRSVATPHGHMVAYTLTIPGTDVAFEMIPAPGGVVRLPVDPPDGDPAYCEVELPPFWIGRCEVTWGEYRKYMELNDHYAELQQIATLGEKANAALEGLPRLAGSLSGERTGDAENLGVDAVTAPTPLYDESTTYESGRDPQLPAVTMTPYAARQYTKWLSALTGHTYRLPSEAEWRHAAAAGDSVAEAPDADSIDAIAWYEDNSEWVAHNVGEKAPNAWGLHDTLGNVAELVLDAAQPAGRPELAGKRVTWADAVAWPTKGAERLALGGWYDAPADEIALGSRMVTIEDEWKGSDPNVPLSPWWYADYPATGVGFRLVRTIEPLPPELVARVWDTADGRVARAVNERLREGRGKLGPIGEQLPGVIEDLGSPAVRDLLE